ncbi:hypothetical protein POR1_17 [Pseudomonas phage POR1]|uniref:Cyanophage baseplate Pam3 plug gp18 domain-containing protein n=1 Tax=Pseudomonas phage POR1 TaxID=1718594 RepID=A0A0N9SG14_9CAUD|nr:hypothetical protein POR1_17 [Pseudomonas phage POR1]
MQTIELYSDDDYYVQLLGDGVLFYLHMQWNSEAEFWTLAIENYNRELLVSGVKVVPNIRLLKLYRYIDGMPTGELIALSDSQAISKTDFAEGYAQMVYVTAPELPQ